MKKYLVFFGGVLALGLMPVVADQVVTDQVDDEVIIGPQSNEFVNVVKDMTLRALFYSNSRNLADPYKITRALGHCGTNGSATDLQTALGLTIYGFGCQFSGPNALADDFVLCGQSTIQQIAFYLYQTNATSPTINRIDYAIMTTNPLGQPPPTWTTVTAPPVSFVTVYKKQDIDAPTAACTRRLQKVTITLSPPVTLAAGQYWLAWRAGGTLTSGPWQPPVVFLNLPNKPGANGLQSSLGANFAPALDGVYPQDLIFELYGTAPAWPTGACCLSTGECVPDTTECECMLSLDGTWQGPQTGCDPNPCEVFIGACCFLDGSCELQFPVDCMAAYGDYLGPNTTCDPNLCPPPCIQCPPGAVPEGEPPCFNGYVDNFNGGCNSTPPVFSPIACGQTVCGTGGNYLSAAGGQSRDTDWYELVTTNPRIFTWTATATFPVLIFVIQAGPEPTPCTGYTSIASATAGACQPATITTACLAPGKYWFWVGTQGFTGVPCNSPYIATLTCSACPPFGACCYPEGYCEEMSQTQCSGIWLGEGTTCTPNTCQPCPLCGPGPHFLDTCAAGDDHLPSSALVGIDMDMDCISDINLVMFGPVKVHRTSPLDDSGHYPNTRPVDGHLDVIDTEILMMHLTGGGIVLTAGGGGGAGGVLAPSLGRIAEYYTDPAVGDSFFDVFFEVDLGGGNYAYNHTALKVQTRVTCMPPYHEYIHVQDCVELYDSPTGGLHIANLVAPIHDAYPFGACCFPDGSCQTMIRPEICQTAGGEFQGFGTLCHPNPCPQPPGACCYPDGSCTIVPEDQCSGIWLGEGTSCIHCEPCAFCGPGPHFIDTCAGGDDALPSSALVGIDTNLDCVADTSLVMFGPVKVHRGNPYGGPPPNMIDTEIVSMRLTGGGGGGGGAILIAGAGLGQGGVLAASLGRMTELPSNPAMADSFFDVFFEVDLGGGNYVYNQTALRVQTLITCIPPYHEYIHVQNCVQLWTSPTPGQGIHVANLVAPDHDAYPFGGACCFPDGSCQTTTVDICQLAGGEWKGAGTLCHPNPCGICLGDVNCDGVVNFGDINPFVLFLSNFPLWQQTYQGCPWQNGDTNGDGTYGTGSFGDINPFVALIVQSPFDCH